MAESTPGDFGPLRTVSPVGAVFPAPLVLLTDFGWEGPYVGQMKGVLATLAPGHPILDLSHSVAPQDVREGAFLLEVSWRRFPSGSVFVAVVDPGVGTERAALAVRAEGRFFVGPDNGLIPGALSPRSSFRAARIDPGRLDLPPLSATFHGRDLFAPAGALLARGLPIEALGPEITETVDLPDRFPLVEGRAVTGRIVHVDRFGNLVSDIGAPVLDDLKARYGEAEIVTETGGWTGVGLRRTYEDAAPGELLALFGSQGYLEVAVRQGSAARRLNAGRGDRIAVTLREGGVSPTGSA
jgi:S-adenosylmethionine hydrolase